MDPSSIDVAIVARDLKLAPPQVAAAIELLDAGNTIPFITRFRKDLTGGLDETQLLAVRQRVVQLRALEERKATILRAIEGQGELTDTLRQQIQGATSSRRLEDLYLPFKTRKQSRASAARQQGLGPLAEEVLSGQPLDLAARAIDFVRVDKGLNSVDDVIKGVADLVSEKFLENDALRVALRGLLRDKGALSTQLAEGAEATETDSLDADAADEDSESDSATDAQPLADSTGATVAEAPADGSGADPESEPSTATETPAAEAGDPVPEGEAADAEAPAAAAEPVAGETTAQDEAAKDSVAGEASPAAGASASKKKKKKKKKKKPDPFKDYHEFEQGIQALPPYRILAINRGERAGKLKVRVKVDPELVNQKAFESLVPAEHPSSEFLKKCALETLNRSLLPSVEREVRRELTEQAERHALEVFANNLRSLLLQPPLRNKTILAIDPGYKHGCSVAIIDPCGNLLETGQVFIVGKASRQEDSHGRIRDWVQQHQVDVIGIGNGTACRQVEKLVSETIEQHLADHPVRYIMVSEAGASVYSTNDVGRVEFPDLTPAMRSAVSIGRRLQDPLSELVKIAPANLGVGMYQHDIRGKHLSDSLEEVVQSCVNQVGVDLNTASVSLLKFVAGLNALTARRIVEYRQEHGRFEDRQQLKEVSGVGEATFIQAAGFLRIYGGKNPLDATSIHPESYPVAEDILRRVEAPIEDLFPRWLMQPTRQERGQDASAPASDDPSTVTAADPSSVEPAVAPLDAAVAETESMPSTAPPETSAEMSAETPAESPAETPVPAASETPVAAVDEAPAGNAGDEDSTGDPAGPDRREFERRRKEVVTRLSELDFAEIAESNQCGKLLVRDIVMTLKRPAWDPRDKVRKPIFRRGIIKLEDLKPQMQLEAQVANVVDFGVFVDIGLGESSLVHVSQLSNHYISDPQRLFSVGDVIKVWVTEVDTARRRVKLTAIRPGATKGDRSRGPRKRREGGGSPPARAERDGAPRRGPRGGGKPRRGEGAPRRKESGPRRDVRRAKPKPVTPITDKMLSGDEPMRSFSDLMQFVQKKPGSQRKGGEKDSSE